MEAIWLTYAKRLQAIASTGLSFTTDPYDRERFDEVGLIANAMLADLASVPLERIGDLVSDFAKGYATPKVDVRGAVLIGDQVLLVQERCDDLWTLPGGFAEVGLSPARNIEKEMFEEAGLTVSATSLYGVRHKAKRPYDPDVRDFYKMFFLCETVDVSNPRPGAETKDARFFPRHRLPPLSRGRVIEEDIEAAFAFANGFREAAFFD